MPDVKKQSLTGKHSITCSFENSWPLRLVSGLKSPVRSHGTCNNTQWQAMKHPEIWNISVKFCLWRIEIAGPLLRTQYYSSPALCEHTPRNCLETATSTTSPHQWPLPDSGLWGQCDSLHLQGSELLDTVSQQGDFTRDGQLSWEWKVSVAL